MNILTMRDGLKTIKLISDAGKKLDERIHQVGVAGIAHFLKHGDTTLISELCHAMPKSARGNALKFWITKHIAVKWSTKAHNGKGGYVKNGDMDLTPMQKVALVTRANDAPFYMKEDKEASVWNPETSILNLVKKLEAYKKEHNLQISENVKTKLDQAIG